jgi:exonuclease SbcD
MKERKDSRTPIGVMSNDWHIDKSNGEQIIDLITQKINLAKELNIKSLFCLGDVFNSRNAQPLDNLDIFERILDMIHSNGLTLYSIPGNHDKVNYNSNKSYLNQYRHHPALKLIDEAKNINIEGCIGDIFMIPFYDTERWLVEFERVKKYIEPGESILLSHIAMEGSINNDGEPVKNRISPSLFKQFKAVYLGHYHNHQSIGKNIWHLPSICQNNYGENSNKGFTILYNDGSFEIVKSKFKKFKTVEIDLDNISKKEFDSILLTHKDLLNRSDSNIRLKVSGSEDKVKSLPIDQLKQMGFDLKVESKDIEMSMDDVEEGNVVEFNNTSIKEEFDLFCAKEEYEDIKIGNKYLTKILQPHG